MGLVVVVGGVDSGETLERLQFNVSVDEKVDGKGFRGNENENIQNIGNIIDAKTKKERGGKSIREIHSEIQAIIRQIRASVTFLPLLDEPCTFDLLVYTDNDVDVPQAWEESDPRYIANSDEVKLRSFTTKVHRVDACVSYKADA